MQESVINPLDDKIRLMLEATQAFFSEFYGKMWNDIVGNNIPKHNFTISILTKNVKDSIAVLLPEAKEIFREVDNEFRSLPRNNSGNSRENFVKKATETTVKIAAKYISREELGRRLEKLPSLL